MTVRTITALALFVSVLLAGFLGVYVSNGILQRAQERRFESMLGELRARLETDLRIGIELPDDVRAQGMIEDAVARTTLLESIEVDSESGTVLFDSDRALRAQHVPDSWRAAARHEPNGWRVIRQDEKTLGLPLRDALGETAGYLVSTYEIRRDTAASRNVLVHVRWIAAVTGALALGGGFAAALSTRQRQAEGLARLRRFPLNTSDHPMEQAARVLGETREVLVQVEQDAKRLGGIDS